MIAAAILAAAVSVETPSVTLFVPSLSCPICQRAIRRGLEPDTRLAGLEYDISKRTARLVLADTSVPADSFVQAVEAIGYVAAIVVDTAAYRVRGGETDVRAAARALLSTPGVRGVEGGDGRLVVLYEVGRVDADDIRAVVRRAAPRLALRRAK